MEKIELTQIKTKECKSCKQKKALNNYTFNTPFCNDCISDEDRCALERLSEMKSKN